MPKLQTLKPLVKTVSLSIGSQLKTVDSYGQGRGGRPWRRTRERILERDKYQCQCEDCQAKGLIRLANEVDHIIPQSQGGSGDDSNLRAINHECHKLKTARESNFGRR